MPFTDAFLPEYDHEMSTTRRVLERLPEKNFAFKPHEKSMSLAQLASHLAEITSWAGAITGSDSFDVAPPGGAPYKPPLYQTRQEVLRRFDENVKAARGLIAGVNDSQSMKPWSLLKGGERVFTLPKGGVLRSMILNHSIHHRGQLTVYLRLNNVPLPQVYGPTADEGM
jgi:uncharacterized damage-inducible protein DinB